MEKLQTLDNKFRYVPSEKHSGSTFHYPNIQEIGYHIANAKTETELKEALVAFQQASNQDVSEVVSAIMDRINKTV